MTESRIEAEHRILCALAHVGTVDTKRARDMGALKRGIMQKLIDRGLVERCGNSFSEVYVVTDKGYKAARGFDASRNPHDANELLTAAEIAVANSRTPEERAQAAEQWKRARLAMDLCNERCE